MRLRRMNIKRQFGTGLETSIRFARRVAFMHGAQLKIILVCQSTVPYWMVVEMIYPEEVIK